MSVTFYGDSFEVLVTKSVCSILYAENFFDIEIGHQHRCSLIVAIKSYHRRDERTRTRIERTLVFVRVRPNMNEHEHGFFKNY